MKVGDLLREKAARIISVRINDTVEAAARLLREENVGAVAVKDVCGSEGDTVVGMFSERDIVRALADYGAAGLAKPVWALMSKTVISCGADDDLESALELMDAHHIRHLPVFDGEALIGVVSIRNLASRLAGLPPRSAKTAPAWQLAAPARHN